MDIHVDLKLEIKEYCTELRLLPCHEFRIRNKRTEAKKGQYRQQDGQVCTRNLYDITPFLSINNNRLELED